MRGVLEIPLMSLLNMQEMAWPVVLSLLMVGLVLLVLGGSWLCKGSVSIALLMQVSPVIIGLTVVSIATSFPELFTSLAAIWKGSPDLAIGNILGSNAANLGLIMGVAALIYPMSVHSRLVRWELPILLAATILFWGIVAYYQGINRGSGILLLLLTSGYLVLIVHTSRTRSIGEEYKEELAKAEQTWCVASLFVVAGAFLLWLGSDLLVESSVTIARRLSVSEVVIGLTLVAVGTSLPELGTTIAAAIKREDGIIVGNIIGSCLFNIFLIGGVAGLVSPFTVPAFLAVRELPLLLGITLLFSLFVFTQKRVSRSEGALLLVLYALFIVISCLF